LYLPVSKRYVATDQLMKRGDLPLPGVAVQPFAPDLAGLRFNAEMPKLP
jgi:hypothetical protein